VYADPEETDTHTITVVSSDANVVVANLGSSSYSLVPEADWFGSATITVTVTEVGDPTSFDSEVYTLTVNPLNDAPREILLSNSVVAERELIGTVVGLFSSDDPDPSDTHSYSFASDGGILDVDNDAFTMVGDTLKTNLEFDYEIKNSYSILVQTDDGNGGVFTQNLTITVSDVDETSVEDIYNNPLLSVYPNPANEFVNVEIDNPENKGLLLDIYSNAGTLVHSERIITKKRIDLSAFSGGMYFIRIRGEQVYGIKKFIVND
jgi:hypothetical protein